MTTEFRSPQQIWAEQARRMHRAHKHLEALEGRDITLDELARRVGEVDPEAGETYSGSVVGRWLSGKSQPKRVTAQMAFARVLKVRGGWLWFDEGTMVELPKADTQPVEGTHTGNQKSA